ncbi:dihydroneopterin aldolase [Methanocaldococcus fervens]|uniref:Dihydroneopterin aldolase n=1 Tax=Methanocaldococcus fervens (strain DSM 4213 / JCM 15782 / AG86) TaxID=573064 RepID=C7P988_METFA|nr:dihydroneopterin aldolase [Methanocaldococcus fervens]ACV25120.1 Protein of unknown function DUF381 [Methanocaldococcus fervens AG86]
MRVEETEIFKKYFENLTDRERAVFEGGITLGALFHQFVGTPVSKDNKESLERAIEEAMKNQPCVYDIKVKIKDVGEKYTSLDGRMLDVDLKIKINRTIAHLKLEYIAEIDYPLMYVKELYEE